MVSMIGQWGLILALGLALLQSVLPLCGYYWHNPYLLAGARVCALGQSIFVGGIYLLLTVAFINSDFSIAYVAANSHAALPFLYRLTAVWGAHEGSILLWIFMLNAWSLAYVFFQKNHPALPLVLATLGMVSVCFLSFLLFTSNPFLAAIGIQTGRDLNPLLQDPGFVIHPPMLYAGYVGFSVAFAITQAALLRGKLDAHWAHITRQFALAAWCFLTLGITLGSWWAYRVLGWGGFWFWDPVENASLLPWLSGIALIHVLLLVEKRGTATGWAVLLSIITFALSLLGTFLVRSGVLISAHTFANDPQRGVFLLLLLALISTAALIVYGWRLPRLTTVRPAFVLISRETALLINSALLIVAMLTILLGTLYPLILDALQLGTISVGAPYFNIVMAPLVFILMAFMGAAPNAPWQGQTFKQLTKQTWQRLLLSCIIAIVLLFGLSYRFDVTALLSLSLSIWIILSVLQTFRLMPSMSLAHLGFAVLVVGVMLSSALSEQREVRIKPGVATSIGPYQFFFISTEGVNGPNYRGIRADFEVVKNGRHIVNLYPEKRIYPVRDMVMTKVDIHPGIFRDLYIALGEPLDHDEWSVRLYYKPFMRWIWFGGVLMMLGGIIAIGQQRKKT